MMLLMFGRLEPGVFGLFHEAGPKSSSSPAHGLHEPVTHVETIQQGSFHEGQICAG